ncbi:LamG domain-containing protein [Planctomycetota bacterium]
MRRRMQLMRLSTVLFLIVGSVVLADTAPPIFALPGSVTAQNNPDNCVWHGMDADGQWLINGIPIQVDLRRWLTQNPPGPCSAVTLPTAHWIELSFPGVLVDGNTPAPCLDGLSSGTDIVVYEKDANQEHVVVFLSDGQGQLQLLDEAYSTREIGVPDANCPTGMVKIGLDLADYAPPFPVRALRILSRGLGGAAPGFDLGRIRGRVQPLARASCPYPNSSAVAIPQEITLAWTPGHRALAQALYIGPTAQIVMSATEPNGVFTPDDLSEFTLHDLTWGQTYFWRVDTVTSDTQQDLIPGKIWTFTVSESVVVDDSCLQGIDVPAVPMGDFNRDSKVGVHDLKILTERWLQPQPLTVTEPNTAQAWFPLDDSHAYWHEIWTVSGPFLARYNNHTPDFVPGYVGQALVFDVGKGVMELEPTSLLHDFQQGITIAFWQLGNSSRYITDTLCSSDNNYPNGGPLLAINLGCWEPPGRAYWRCGDPQNPLNQIEKQHLDISEWANVWNHWAFTKDFRTGQLSIYRNGILWAQQAGTPGDLSQLKSLTFGDGWLNTYDGLLDELQIYDYALSASEAAFLATNGTGQPVPVPIIPDLNKDGKINLHDFAELSRSW